MGIEHTSDDEERAEGSRRPVAAWALTWHWLRRHARVVVTSVAGLVAALLIVVPGLPDTTGPDQPVAEGPSGQTPSVPLATLSPAPPPADAGSDPPPAAEPDSGGPTDADVPAPQVPPPTPPPGAQPPAPVPLTPFGDVPPLPGPVPVPPVLPLPSLPIPQLPGLNPPVPPGLDPTNQLGSGLAQLPAPGNDCLLGLELDPLAEACLDLSPVL